MIAKQLLEPGALESRVALAVALQPLVNDHVKVALIELRVQLCPGGIAHAVGRPRTAVLHKGPMIGRMPVTCRDHVWRGRSQLVHPLDHLVTVWHWQRTAGAEIVLDVDDDQRLHPGQYSQVMTSRLCTIRDDLQRVLLSPEEAVSLEVHGQTDAAVLVPLYIEDDEIHAVFTKRREDLRRHPGEISFPGGRYDEGEPDLRATALREAHEEIGLPPDAVEILGALQPTPTIATGYAVYPFVGLIEPGRVWTLSAREVAEVLELSLSALRSGYARRRLIRRGLPIRTDTYLVGDHLIWGATARILADLFDRIEPLLARDAG